MRNRRNYYRILQVQPDAPQEVIRSAYRALLLQVGQHPDRGGDTAVAALLNEAYGVLSDPHSRAEYDRSLNHRVDLGRGAERRRQATSVADSPPPFGPQSSCCPFCESPIRFGELTVCGVCDGPLESPDEDAFSESGNRAASRLRRRQQLSCQVGWPRPETIQVELCDLSPQGVRIRSRCPLAEGSRLLLAGSGLRAIGVVVRSENLPSGDGYESGVRLLTLAVRRGSLLSVRR